MPRRSNNPYTDETINMLKLPKEEDLPYKAIGDTLVIIPMEVMDGLPVSLILMPGQGSTDSQKLQSRLLKGKVISIGEGVVGFEKFIMPDRPQLGDIVYFEAHCMKRLPFNFGLLKFEHCLFVLDDDKAELAKKIEENDRLNASRKEDGLNIGNLNGLGVTQKY